MTSNNEINKNNNTFASNDAKDDELKVINLDFNDNDCCVRDEEEGEEGEEESKATMEDWHQQFNTTDEELMQENYENCKFQLETNYELWTHEELQLFAEQIQIYEASHLATDYDESVKLWQARDHSLENYVSPWTQDWTQEEHQKFAEQIQASSHLSTDYDDAVNLWKSHGLSQEQYDAHLVYENAVNELEAYYELGEDEEDLEYETTLKTIIETFEKEMDEKDAAEAKADDENDWWMDANDCCESSDNEEGDDDDEDEEDEGEEDEGEEDEGEEEEDRDSKINFEDWMEAKREEDMESARQNAMDDR
jgi:hypothetical protein